MSTFYAPTSELYHYGVLGMKWGVRRARKFASAGYTEKSKRVLQKTYERSSAKLAGYDRRGEKYQTKANKLRYKADRKKYGLFGSKKAVLNAEYKAGKTQYKATKQYKRGYSFYQQMNKTFKNTSINLTKSQHSTGKKFAKRMTMRSMSAAV